MGDIVPVPNNALNSNTVIKKFSISGTKKQGFKLAIMTFGNGMSSNYYSSICLILSRLPKANSKKNDKSFYCR